MNRRVDLVTAAIAIAVHAGLAFAIVRDPGRPRARPRPIEVEFRKPKEVAVAAPKPPPPPPPRPVEPVRPSHAPRRKLAVAAEPSPAPPPAAPEPRPAPRLAPVFGIAMDSPTAATSPVSAPVGGTTRADPAAPARPGRRGPADGDSVGSGTGAPVSELEIKTMPEIDTDACGKTITYPADAEQNGIQGNVRLRVTLDERGHVRAARVLSGLGHGLDQAAVEALTHRCRFTPAIAKDGRAVPFVVESYTFHFELPR